MWYANICRSFFNEIEFDSFMKCMFAYSDFSLMQKFNGSLTPKQPFLRLCGPILSKATMLYEFNHTRYA